MLKTVKVWFINPSFSGKSRIQSLVFYTKTYTSGCTLYGTRKEAEKVLRNRNNHRR